MRIIIWKQWKTSQKRCWGLRKLGAPEWMAKQSVVLMAIIRRSLIPQDSIKSQKKSSQSEGSLVVSITI